MEKKKIIILSSIILGVLVLTLGITYALFSYQETSNNTSQLIMGDIYMHYKENNQLILNNAMPQEGFKTLITGYKVNPIMADQDASDTTTELYACINLFQNEWGWGLDEGEDFESFCQGAGTVYGWTFQMNLDDSLSEDEYNTMLSLNIIQEETLEYTGIKMNPEIATQTAEYENELTACVCSFDSTGINELLDEGTTTETFCQGTGTFDGGLTFQQWWDKFNAEEGFMEEIGNTLVDNNIMVLENDLYVVNPNMANQTVRELNELMTCIDIFTRVGYEFDEGTTAESFCKGEGTYDGGITLKGEFEEAKDNIYYMIYVGSKLLDNNIILASVDLPYFEFTISGKNTYSEKDIYYDIKLDYGDPHETRNTRLEDNFLKFRLIEVNPDKTEKIIFDNKSYSSIENKVIHVETIKKNTMDEINKTYRLYMWINEDVVIGNIDEDYTIEEWNDVFASIKVNVSGDLTVKEPPKTMTEVFIKNIEKSTDETCDPIIEDEDGTIYISGDNECIDFNYVWYSGKIWRITAINPDGTLKMITEDQVTDIFWGASSDYKTSYMREWLNQEFLPTLYNYENIIVTDYSDKSYKWNLSPVLKSYPDSIDKIVMLDDPIGLLNLYEYYQSFKKASYGEENGYLNIEEFWWFLSPYDEDSVWYMSNDVHYYGPPGTVRVVSNPWGTRAVRPVVNLLSSVEFKGGDGTETNPYTLKLDNDPVSPNVTLINTRQSGEYVKIENDMIEDRAFRIINTELINGVKTTKLVTSDYVRDVDDIDADGDAIEVLIKPFGSNETIEELNHAFWANIPETDETFWKGYLNNTWLEQLDYTYNEETGSSQILEKGIYYSGEFSYPTASNIGSYKLAVCNTYFSNKSVQDCINDDNIVEHVWSGYVGLLRFGELFSGYPKRPIIRPESEYYYYRDYWLMTIDNSWTSVNNVRHATIYTMYGSSQENSKYPTRPTINLKSNLVIKSGSGTELDPFVVGLPS